VKVETSADLVQKYEACWTPQQLESHLEAGRVIDRVIREGFARVAQAVRDKKPLTEYELQQWILQEFFKAGLTTEEGPDVAGNAHASDPHYAPAKDRPTPIAEGDLLLLDVWGKTKAADDSVYYDISWVGYVGAKVPEKFAKVFSVLVNARDRAVKLIEESVKAG